jgi:Fur family peroxide stress response transcriptional regulator
MKNNPLITSLQESGAKMTAQRIAICDWLADNADHPTAAEVHEALSTQFPTMSLATVYNTLGLLAELDLVHAVGTTPDGSMRYDPNTTPHINLKCTNCGNIIDVMDADLSVFDGLAPAYGFEIEDVQIVIHGICNTCKSEMRDTE